MPTVKITKKAVEDISFTKQGQKFYFDSNLRGFGLRVGTKTKAYFVERRVNGRTVRATIGPHGVVVCEQARKQAQKLLGKLVSGIDVNQERQADKSRGVTLQEAFEEFLKKRDLKARTVKDYKGAIRIAFPDWKYKAVVDITRDMVGRRHTKLGEKLGHAQANQVFRFLRSLFNFIAGNYENGKGGPLVADNPVKRITETKSWYRVDRRRSVIKYSDLPAWYQGVLGLKSELGRDFLLFVLLTGIRKSEAQRVEVEHIDLNERTFIIPDTKNRVPLVLPIPMNLHKMLKGRIAKLYNSKYLFPSRSKHGYLAEPKKSVERVIELSGVEFCLHDLRRSFINIAEGLDLSAYAIKQLVNHSIESNDVTAGYLAPNVDRLRDPMQRIENRILQLAKVGDKGKIIKLKTAN